MKYQIFYTDSAKQDLKNIYRYICDSLVEPEIAEKLTDKIMKSIRSLDEMPQRYRLFDEEPWRSRGLRILPVNNYLIFYLSDEERTVLQFSALFTAAEISASSFLKHSIDT